jgi:hypothetical protein
MVYWKQRGTIKWVKLGDEGTKFFHANASIRQRRNLITTLKDANDQTYSDHQTKANILWEAFKDRLGTSDNPDMSFNLQELLHRDDNLDFLTQQFTHEEIDTVVSNLPRDKSPGPDGFNTDFVKKCWSIIKFDFYRLCDAFHLGSVCLESINGSHITLLPKVDAPSKVFDIRPISLVNTSIKIITKLLANRLQQCIMRLIHQNQYGFIKSRTIQDCLAWPLNICICVTSQRKN